MKIRIFIYWRVLTIAEHLAACGKPFPVSIIAILDGGKSDILSLKAN